MRTPIPFQKITVPWNNLNVANCSLIQPERMMFSSFEAKSVVTIVVEYFEAIF